MPPSARAPLDQKHGHPWPILSDALLSLTDATVRDALIACEVAQSRWPHAAVVWMASGRVYRGIGLASFVENSNPSSATYGMGGASIAAQDACTMKLTATGGITVASSMNELGQGGYSVIAQVAATWRAAPEVVAQRFGTRLAFFNKVRRELDPNDRLVNQFFQAYLPQT